MENKTDLFLNRIFDMSELLLPDRVIIRAKCALLDYIGVTFAGLQTQRKKLDLLIDSFCENSGKIYPVGISTPMSMNNAAFLNGLNGHALDFDDGTNAGIIHLGSPIFSVLLALAQRYKISGERLLRAAVIGYETSFTMAMSIQPVHKQRGYHATGTCGLLGIAVAGAIALGFDREKTKQVFSIAAVSVTGTLKVLEDGSQLKPYNVAKTAMLGLIALQMANAGFIGPDDVLSGKAGFLSQMYGSDSVEIVSTLLNGTYAIEKAYIKPYAACRYTHPSIEAALVMRKKYGISANDEIESVKIRTYSLAVNKHDHTEIAGCGSAKMSIPYSVAAAICKGSAGMPEYEPECVNDSELLALTKKVSVIADDKMSADFPTKQTATVEITMYDGKVYSETVDFPKGEPENPMSVDEAKDKFTSLTLFSGRNKTEANEIFSLVMEVENRLDELLEIIKG